MSDLTSLKVSYEVRDRFATAAKVRGLTVRALRGQSPNDDCNAASAPPINPPSAPLTTGSVASQGCRSSRGRTRRTRKVSLHPSHHPPPHFPPYSGTEGGWRLHRHPQGQGGGVH